MKILFKELTLDTDLKQCYINGDEIPLSKSEYNLLLFLLNNRNKIFTRKEVVIQAWGKDSKISNRAVDTAVSRLRKKLRIIGNHIHTRFGFGYGFID